jgi:hypothetical protein
MNARIHILMALLGCLVFGGNALATELRHCNPLCCDEPCESRPLVPESCARCAVRSTAEADPMLPPLASATSLPAVMPATPALPRLNSIDGLAAQPSAPAPSPLAARSSILRL